MFNSNKNNLALETTVEPELKVLLVAQGLDLLTASQFTLLGGRCICRGQRCPEIT